MPSTPSWTCSANTVSSTNAEPAPARTRGRTRPGRLTRLDAVLMHCEAPLLAAPGDAWFVDVGVGEWPWTTLESAARFRALNPRLRVLGVDLDPKRVRNARRVAAGRIDLREGGFEPPLEAGESARLVRAMNVLRGYGERDAERAHLQLTAALVPGGLLVEGTSSPSGGVLCAHFVRRRPEGLAREGLLFLTDFSQGFAPWLFRDRLPRDLRRRVQRGTAIHAFFTAWHSAFESIRAAGVRENSALFALSALAAARRVDGLDLDPTLIERGALLWRPRDGVPNGPP